MSDGKAVKINPENIGKAVTEQNLSPQGEAFPSPSALPFNNMYRGYFPLWRKIVDWGWYKEANTARVFIHLLLLANFSDKHYLGHIIKRGQCVAGRKSLSASLALSERQIRTTLKRLIATNEIAIKTYNKFSIITLNNFEKYLINDPRGVRQATNKSPASDQQTTTPYNDKNDKKTNKENTLSPIIDFFKSLKGYTAQPDWDKNHWRRHCKAAKELLAIAPCDWKEAMSWVSEQKYCDWTLETVIKKLPDFRKPPKNELRYL